jgi:hypothetical protein
LAGVRPINHMLIATVTTAPITHATERFFMRHTPSPNLRRSSNVSRLAYMLRMGA